MNGKSLIELMVQETFTDINSASNVVSISRDKTKKVSAFHDRSRKCLILYSSNAVLEIPENFQALDQSNNIKLKFGKNEENLEFFEVVSKHFDLECDSFVIDVENSDYRYQTSSAA